VAGGSVKQAGLPTDYYAPDYKILIEGQELDPESKGDILEVKVVMDMDNMTSFELNVNNWDDKTFSLKYDKRKSANDITYDLGSRVHVKMGYAGNLLSMATGQITTLAPKFPESGSPTISISGLDGMLKLRDRKPTETDIKKFVKKTDHEIAQIVASRNGLDVKVTKTTQQHDLVIQKNQDDAQFLMERAKRIDFDCFVQTAPKTGKDTLYFVKPTDGRSSDPTRIYVFTWGESLMSFMPQITLARQVSKVTVRGWSAEQKDVFSYTADKKDLPGGGSGTNGPQAAGENLNDKQEVVVDAPVTSQKEAQDLATSLLTERAYQFITGTGQVIGIPDLRPGDNLDLQGLGTRFSGEYYVKKVEHRLGNNGYMTQFDVRRLYEGKKKK
jgi:phage protein D